MEYNNSSDRELENDRGTPTADWVLAATSPTFGGLGGSRLNDGHQPQQIPCPNDRSSPADFIDNLGLQSDIRKGQKLLSLQQLQPDGSKEIEGTIRAATASSTSSPHAKGQPQHDSDSTVTRGVMSEEEEEEQQRRRRHQEETESKPGAIAVFSQDGDVYINHLSKGRLSRTVGHNDEIDSETGKGMDEEEEEEEQGKCNKKRKLKSVGSLCFVFVAILVVVIALAGNGNKGIDNDRQLLLDTQQLVEHLTSPENIHVFDNPASPQYKALRWLAYNDTTTSGAGDTSIDIADPIDTINRNFETRYALAVLYFATNKDCYDCTNGGIEQSRSSKSKTAWHYKANFLSPNIHECNWTSSGELTDDSRLSVVCDSFNRISSIKIGKCQHTLHEYESHYFRWLIV